MFDVKLPKLKIKLFPVQTSRGVHVKLFPFKVTLSDLCAVHSKMAIVLH